jgi:CBS domain-containing protein
MVSGERFGASTKAGGMLTQCPSCGTTNLEGIDECAYCGADLSGIEPAMDREHAEPSAMHLPLTALQLSTVQAIAPETTVGEAVQTLVRQQMDFVQIVENHKLIGVLSVRDIMTRIGCDYAAKLGRPVREFMTMRVETLPPDAPITFGMNKMDVGGYRHIPILQEGRVLGVASAEDMVRYLLQSIRAEDVPQKQAPPPDDIDPPGAFLR